MKHEKGTLEAVVKARNKSLSANNVGDKKEGENQLTQALGKLFALAESYPELKADTQFSNLSQNLSGIEDEIAKSDDPKIKGKVLTGDKIFLSIFLVFFCQNI